MENTKKVAANAATAFIANGDLPYLITSNYASSPCLAQQYATTLTTRLRLWK